MEVRLGTRNRIKSLIDAYKSFTKNKSAAFGLWVTIFYILLATVIQFVLPLITLRESPINVLRPPRLWPPAYWFGTDYVGQSTLADIIGGAPFILETSFLAGIYTTVIGLIVGLVSGYIGGIADNIIMWINDTLLTLPSLLLVIMIATMIKTTNPLVLAGVLSITGWTGLARAVRSQVLSIKQLPYIEVSKVLGLGWSYIMFKEVMPQLIPFVWINLILNVEGAIYATVGLFYLGLMPYTSNNWGFMISNALSLGAAYGTNAIWYFIFPTLFVTLFMVGLIELAYGIDEVVNPRLRKV
ncbi:peptide ABC transporter permease [Thermocladium modestius]|uniref:Peptide ABC transporter permease n=1 Tax=Thermocladium modestius TaxID=62609 RepID=A0A830GRI8_9CREN|nr:ABC transporter permease [Thermocladium modestius]GGP19577.1 peptide ABC transporter permease [Thermocladium modestius]